MNVYRNWVLGTRPWSFSMTAISISVGSTLAAIDGHFSWFFYLLTLLGGVFIHDASNVILLGPPGVGKTHLAVALAEAAIREGMSRRVAETFVHQTIRGAGHLLTETGIGAPRLRSQVTSPGGTTAAAVHVLEERGFRALVEDAVRAAAKRSRELGSGE